MPILFFSLFEIYNLNQTEEELTQIYDQQLSSITFAANQYADDIVQNWLSELNLAEDYSQESLDAFLNNHWSVDAMYLYDFQKLGLENMGWKVNDSSFHAENLPIENILAENEGLIEKLGRYFEADYQKKFPLTIKNDSSRAILLCVVGKNKNKGILAALVINIKQFTFEVLGPRLQQLSRGRFVFVVHDQRKNMGIFYTKKNFTGELVKEEKVWILPDQTLYVYSTGVTIEDTVRQRANVNLWMLIGLNVILIAVVFLVFRNLRRELELAQYKSDFVSNVSHELRTPLALIRMFAETLELKRVPTEDKKEEYHRIIRQESERLTGIVNKILNFSELDSGKRAFTFQDHDICKLVKDTMYTYEYHLKQKGFDWELACPDSSPMLSLDHGAISEAVVNLIDNAVKYSEEKKFIKIFFQKGNKEFGLSVSDQGIGISPEHQKAIFDKFFRVTKGSLYSVQGTGLGLSLVQDIMKAHQGRISLESQLGEGSTFTLWFPLQTPKKPKE
ncbi:MAG: HAMP domain-containing histidine kinase [Bacteroidia bacterium]|nr:HAMP domain-containing histidine kinase [Bacteroidia bacterium]